MSYLKCMGTSFVYIAFFLAVITFSPGLPPIAEFSEYSIKPPVELTGVLATNERLNDPEILFDGEIKGPESFDSYNGELYTSLHGGSVGKIVGNKIIPVFKFSQKCDGLWDEERCGRPLGLKFDKQGRLYVADAYYGIFKVDVKTGKYEKLVDSSQPIDGKVPMFINSVDVAENGDVYWTESTTEFKLKDGAFAMLTNPSGRLYRYNAATKKNEVLLKNLGLANGLKLSDDESYLIVAESMSSVLIKYHLKGAKAGKHEVLIDGLPGVPDNIHSDGQGNYLVSIVLFADPENPILTQTLAPHPYVRKMLLRLQALAELPFKLLDDVYPNDFAKKVAHAIGHFESTTFMYPRKVIVLRIDGNGKILDALHNTDEKITGISSAFVHDNYLWLGSPFNEFLARVPLKKAFPNTVFAQKAKEAPRVTRDVPKVEKPAAAAPKVATPTPKPQTTTAAPPTTTEAPKAAKIERTKPQQAQKEPERKQELPKKVETPKKEIPVRENEIPKASKQEKPAKKAENVRQTTEELPRPIKQSGSAKPTQQEAAKPKQQEPAKAKQEPVKPKQEPAKPKQAEPAKPKQQENPKPPKKTEPTKRSTKLSDEI